MIDTLRVPTFEDIKKAHQVIRPYAHITPVFSSTHFNKRVDAQIFLKCENFQKVGAFKFRGACNAILTLSEEAANKGVATHSSGNHAQAVALSAKIRGINAYIVMPENAPKVKIAAVQEYGAEVTFCKPTLEAREEGLQDIVSKTGATVIHPYNDNRIVAGQGTAAIELLESQPDLDIIMTPVGGGGLLSGTAISAKAINKNILVYGAEPKEADDAYRSFKAGTLIPVTSTNTIADGLRTSLGELPFTIIKDKVDDIITVSEEDIIDAMRYVWERFNMIIEASCAVPVAAVICNPERFAGKKVGIIITGGNVDLDHLPWQK